MNLRKSKKLVLKILLSVLVAFTVSAVLPGNNNITYATSHTCPTGWTAEGSNQCSKNESIACPTGYLKSASESTSTKTICTKITATSQDSAAQIDRANFLLSIQRFLNKLIWPILILIGGLMDNSLLFGSGMEEHLRDIWIPIRNLVNILFVIILVGIALYNVLGIGDENSEYSIKSVLPKIIIGIIAVNFSFLGIKVFLDAVNVLTVSVFSLPGQVNEGLEQIISNNPNDEVARNLVDKFCRNIQGFTSDEFTAGDEILQQQSELDIYRTLGSKYLGSSFQASMSKADIDAAIAQLVPSRQTEFDTEVEQYKNAEICNGAHELTPTGKLFLSRWNGRNAALALALNMGKIVFYEEVHPDSLKNIEKLAINTLFSVLLYLVYVASFVALFAVLLARLVVLWLSIAVSPVLLLVMAAPSLKDKLGGFSKIEEQFVKNAIAPLLIALAMTIGWIMLKAIQGANFIDSTSSFGVSKTSGIPVVGLSTLQDLIVALGTVGVVWLGVFSAAEGTLAQFATDAMKGFLENAGKWIGSLPFKHVPFIPVKVPGAEGEHVSTGGEVMEAMHDIFADKPQRGLSKALGIDTGGHPTDLEDVENKAGLYKHLNEVGRKGELHDPDQIEALKRWRNDGHKDEFNEADRELGGNLKKLIEEKDEKKRKEIADMIKGLPLIRNASAGTKPPAGSPSAPSGAAVEELKPETQYRDGKAVKDILTDAENLEAGQSRFNRNLNELAGTLDTLRRDTADSTTLKDEQKAEVRASFDQLTIDGQKPSQATLKTLLGSQERYNYLEQVIGKSDLDSQLGAGTPPAGAPPAPPAAPAAGGPSPGP